MDTKWCTVCDRYIEFYEDELYCSESCRFKDAHGSHDHTMESFIPLTFNTASSSYTLSPPASPVRSTFSIDGSFQPSSPTYSPLGFPAKFPTRYIALKPKRQRISLVR
ncbi:hypothetical protein K493DRAFT_317851 [Basidiobolus meristosporus CBS 931.73]|uniref:Uncharacterized protein n=1 Tax=Basidiobolus meristosporus CBS 931.73 TaxID=1314790 RepID=A0A1Y1XZ04_9FUNG|nr:hypothetical protein K493DRAFT_317851 [Basidiobolus meristosporus CBS 931.73]|eukprot:ORX90604.1 hypothetical protein K493DRAFT_317851 [Basidiobolus meristosporus CBS 931.73]